MSSVGASQPTPEVLLLTSSRSAGRSQQKPSARVSARIGVVNRTLPAAEVVPTAQQYVRQVDQQLHAGLGPAEKEAQALMLASFGRPDFAEGVQSYMERRSPKFAPLDESAVDG
jgi:enoyl-CoA hydratase/carnithine racemase